MQKSLLQCLPNHAGGAVAGKAGESGLNLSMQEIRYLDKTLRENES